MKKLKLIYFLTACLLVNQLVISQTEIDTCLDEIIGNVHGHIFGIINNCDNEMHITSDNESQTTITGSFISSESIKIIPGDNGVKILPVSTDHIVRPYDTIHPRHTLTHIKVRPPAGGRFLAFKSKQKKLVYPNPAETTIAINTEGKLNSAVIYNLYGVAVLRKNLQHIDDKTYTIDISSLGDGFYTVVLVMLTGETATETLIKN